MKKLLQIDLSTENLLSLAENAVDDDNYIGALKMLNKNAELNGNSAYSHMLYAEIYDDLGLFEKCINEWFAFLDSYTENDEDALSDAYEGLAIAYMNLGNDHFSAFYYKKLLGLKSVVTEGMREFVWDSIADDASPLKFVYPPEIADYTDEIAKGIDCMKNGDCDSAVAQFEQVDSRNADYVTARNYIAMCRIIDDKNSEAEAECLKILSIKPDDVQALTTLAAVKTEQKKTEESKQLAAKLLHLNAKNTDEIFKIATVCCENGMHDEAYGLFCKLEEHLPYDNSVLYFKAVSAFNSGRYDSCLATFDKLLAVYPEAVTARYHSVVARESKRDGSEKLSYFYRLPQDERESSVKLLAAFAQLSDKHAVSMAGKMDISDCIRWCFDETENPNGTELQILGAVCAVKARLDEIIRGILLNAFIADDFKIKVLGLLGERNEENCFGVVICNILKVVPFCKITLGRKLKKQFIAAYASLVAHFGMLDERFSEKFADAAEEVYDIMLEGDWQAKPDIDTLAAAIYLQSKVKISGFGEKKIYEFFKTDRKKVAEILGE